MKVLAAVLLAALAAPAHAVAAPKRFDLVGIRWQGAGDVSFRTRALDGRWSKWRIANAEDDRPDMSTREGRASRAWRLGNPFWVGRSTAIEYRKRGEVRNLRATFVSSTARAIPLRALSVAGSPPVIPRSAWGADETITKAPSYANSVRFAVVHHSAGTNTYTRAESAAIVRSIQRYHVRGNGWNDIGYNFLVDKYGQIFEGRAGGIEQNVIGAHAEGFNTGSIGIAVLGTYGNTGITTAARQAVERLVAWRLDVAHVDPLSSLSWISGGNGRFAAGTAVPLRAISAHRDTGFTACPGDGLYRQLPTIARASSELGLPKLYDVTVVGRPGGLVRFTARLSAPVAWSISVADGAGNTVASSRGDGPTLEWTWDATTFAPGRYTYVIEAGADVRPATGILGQQAPASLTLTGAQARPQTFTPNGDSQADSTTISYTLSLSATVTATLRDAFGSTMATLFVQEKRPGRHTFRFTAAGVPDGRYVIVIVARAANGREVRVEVPVVIDRTLAALAATPSAISPNGDRRGDELALTFVLATAVEAKVRILRGSRVVATVFEGPLAAGPQRLAWSSRVPEGAYAAVVEAVGPFGTRAQTARFVVDVTKPKLRLLSARLMRFSVSEAGTLVVNSNGRATRVPVRAGWVTVPSAAAGTFTARLWDNAGNRSSVVRYP